MQRIKKVHYGWIVTIGCGMILFSNLGLAINSFSVFLQPVIDSLHLTKAAGSSILSVQNTAGIVMMIASGKIYKHFKVRNVSLFCGALIVAGYLLYSFSDSLYGCYSAAALIGAGWGGGSMIPVSILLTEWFDHSRGIAFGIAAAGSGIATMLYPPILAQMIVDYGLSAAFVFQAGSIAVFTIASYLLIRNKPEDINLLPYRKISARDESDTSVQEPLQAVKGKELRYREAKKTGRFYKMIFVAFFIGASVTTVITHFSVVLASFNYSLIYTGYMVSLFAIFMIIGKFLYGFAIDHLKRTRSNAYIFTLWSLALGSVFCLYLGGLSPLLFAVLVGLGSPIGSIALPVWTEELFGKQDYAMFFTTFTVSFNIGASLGLLLPGVAADHTGSYTPAFLVYIVCTGIAFCILYSLCSGKTAERGR